MQKKTKPIRVDAEAHDRAVKAGVKLSVVATKALNDAADKMEGKK
jgi:hypothetical protein